MLYEIEQRLLNILRVVDGINTLDVFISSLDSVQLPVAVINVRPFTYNRNGSGLFTPTVPCDITLYFAQIGTQSELLNHYEAAEYIDQVMQEFAARPALQYNDTGLSGMSGNIQIRLQQDSSRPLRYPQGFADAPHYWGAVIRIDVPFMRRIDINVSGSTS